MYASEKIPEMYGGNRISFHLINSQLVGWHPVFGLKKKSRKKTNYVDSPLSWHKDRLLTLEPDLDIGISQKLEGLKLTILGFHFV